MLTIELSPEAEKRLAEFARLSGRSEGSCARELIEVHIDDLEDTYVAEARLKDRQTPLSGEPARREPGLCH